MLIGSLNLKPSTSPCLEPTDSPPLIEPSPLTEKIIIFTYPIIFFKNDKINVFTRSYGWLRVLWDVAIFEKNGKIKKKSKY